MRTVRVELPPHLRAMAGVGREVEVEVRGGAVTIASVLDTVEARHPVLQGTIRDHGTGRRRDFIRYFACGRDLSFEAPDAPVPEAVAAGDEALCVVGAIAGG